MRLPFIQVTTEVIEQAAPDVATILDVPVPTALGHIVLAFKWILGRVPEGELPSAHDLVKGPHAPKLIAAGAQWKGDARALVEAMAGCTPALLDEPAVDGIRFKGLDRYDVVVTGEEGRREKARQAAHARWGKKMPEHAPSNAQALPEHPVSSARPMLGDAKTQTQTQTQIEKKKNARGEEKQAADPRFTPLRRRLEEAFKELRSTVYGWSARDSKEMITLLGRGTDDDIVRMWRVALTSPHDWHRCNTLADLVRKWAHVTELPGSRPPPPEPTQTEQTWREGIPAHPGAKEVWRKLLDHLQGEGKTYAVSWLEQLVPAGLSGDRLRLLAKDKYFRDWMEDQYRPLLDEKFGALEPPLTVVVEAHAGAAS